ncbi:MAG TPA: hypothetical protein VEW95_13285 [Candidatus Limnocylindrales bacterium]|nr:hypothetical protein [Candidatus Limnocylindrales bacterium]
MIGLMLVAAVTGCSMLTSDPYPLPSGPPNAGMTAPAAVGSGVPGVVLFLTPRPGDRIELLSAEPIGVAAGADVRFFFSPPVLHPNGDKVIGEDLQELSGATFSNETGIEGPDSMVGIVAEITAREPGRYQLTAVRLHYRVNGGDEQVREGIDTTLTVCADDPKPASCEE